MDDVPERLHLELVQVEKTSSLEKGDHLAVRGRIATLKYSHHGIFLGPSMQVVDFGSDSDDKGNPIIRKCDLLEFKGDRPMFKLIYPEGTCNTAEAAISLAKEVVKHPEIWGPYNLSTNNCEHFATRCKTGKAYSIQVENVKKIFKKAKEAAKSSSANASCSVV